MDEYTFESVLIDPNKEGVDSLIGKEVYFHDNPSFCIMKANQKSTECLGVLVKIVKDSANPFRVEQSGSVYSRSCIIPKKEEPKPKYVPFKRMEEFVERYTEVRKAAELGSLNDNLFQCGMWLKEKRRPGVYCMVVEIWNCGVNVSSNRVSTEENSVVIDFTLWENLYLDYTFLDGSPCGKVEDNNG